MADSERPYLTSDQLTALIVSGDLSEVTSVTVNGGAAQIGAVALTIPALATNAILLGSAAAAGAATTTLRSNDTIAAFDAVAPVNQAFGDAAAVGTAAFAARRDHKHGMPSATGLTLTTTTLAGVTTLPGNGSIDGSGNLNILNTSVLADNNGVTVATGKQFRSGSGDIILGCGTAGAVILRPLWNSNNNILRGSAGAWTTYDGSAVARNTLDDGSGNAVFAGTLKGKGSSQSVTGSKVSGAALTSLLTVLATIGLIVDNTTA